MHICGRYGNWHTFRIKVDRYLLHMYWFNLTQFWYLHCSVISNMFHFVSTRSLKDFFRSRFNPCWTQVFNGSTLNLASVSNWKHTGLLLISMDSLHSVFCDNCHFTCTWRTLFCKWPWRPILWHWFRLDRHDESLCVYRQRKQHITFFGLAVLCSK